MRVLRILILLFSLPAVTSPVARGQEADELMGAFEALYDALSRTYPYTAHKAMDWETMRLADRPAIERAIAEADTAAFYTIIRHRIHAIPDRHVKIRNEPPGIRDGAVGGSYGLGLDRTSAGLYVVSYVFPGGPASRGGINVGDIWLTRNGENPERVVQRTDITWARGSGGTAQAIHREKMHWVNQAPLGTKADWTFQAPDGSLKHARLEAEFDAYGTLNATEFYATDDDRNHPVTWRRMGDGIGYIRITTFAHPDVTVARQIPRDFSHALDVFEEHGIKDLVVDVRQNSGGSDELAASMAGHFHSNPAFYLQVATTHAGSASLVPSEDPEDLLYVEPADPFYSGRTVVMVSPGTVSAGEGFALAVSQSEGASVVSFQPSNGSYGITGGRVELPGGYRVVFPESAAVDEDGHVLIDGDVAGHGGVQPTVRLEKTRDDIVRIASGEDPELEKVRAWIINQRL